MPTFSFGHDLTVSGTIGIGTWAWGAKQPWGWTDEMEADAKAAFEAAADEGISFFDTAEVYGDGELHFAFFSLSFCSFFPFFFVLFMVCRFAFLFKKIFLF